MSGYRVSAAITIADGVPRASGPVAQPAPTMTEARRIGAELGEGATIGDRWGNRLAVYRGGRWVALA